jgi:hypothetical protein
MRRFVTAAAAVAFGLAPVLALAAPGQEPANQTGAAPIPDGTIGKAGAALRDVAKLQEKYQGRIDTASPEQKKGLSEQANAEAIQAIQSHGISVQEYSQVVRTAQNNQQVKQRLLDAAKQGD